MIVQAFLGRIPISKRGLLNLKNLPAQFPHYIGVCRQYDPTPMPVGCLIMLSQPQVFRATHVPLRCGRQLTEKLVRLRHRLATDK